MDREAVITGLKEVFTDILPDFDPATLQLHSLLTEISPNLDSVSFSEIILGIEDQFDIEVPDNAFDAETTVSDVVDFVLRKV